MEIAPASAHAAALWAGLCLVLLLALSGLVVRQRRRHSIAIGDGGVPELLRAQRAFGNAVEYTAPALAGLAVLVVAGASAPVVHALGGCLFAGRLLHGIGLSLSAGVSIGRSGGMLLTWVAWLGLAATLLVYAL